MPGQKHSRSDTQPISVRPDLGPRIAVYRGRSLARKDLWTLFLPGVLAVVSSTGYGIWLFRDAYTHYGPVAAEDWSTPWFALGSLSLAVFALLLAYRLLLGRPFVAVHQHGLHLRPGLGRRVSLRWGDLAGVASQVTREHLLGLPVRTTLDVWLVPAVGRPIRLPRHLQNLPELVSRVKASLYPRLFPGLQAAFIQGQWLFFGPVSIQANALEVRGRRAQWGQVAGLSVQAGSLVIEWAQDPLPNRSASRPRRSTPARVTSACTSIPLAHIPNPELLLQIVQQGVKV